jgi:hypothetical protein
MVCAVSIVLEMMPIFACNHADELGDYKPSPQPPSYNSYGKYGKYGSYGAYRRDAEAEAQPAEDKS